MSLWDKCKGNEHIAPHMGKGYRIVENQRHTSTRKLVDNNAEHDVLEDMIEASKPPRMLGTESLDYLLATPFRYPPLQNTSRFGTAVEPSIFYGSVRLETALAEKAYYTMFRLYDESTAEFDSSEVNCTSFSFNYQTEKCIQLHQQPFEEHRTEISNPENCATAQALGESMRNNEVDAFTFFSARCKGDGINIGLFGPTSFTHQNHKTPKQWTCFRDNNVVNFYDAERKTKHEFLRTNFA